MPQGGSPGNSGYLPASSALVSIRAPADEVTSQLQRRLVQEAGERDAAKLTLQRLKGVVEITRQRFQMLLVPPAPGVSPGRGGDDQNTAQRGREVMRELETEVRNISLGVHGASALAPGSPAKGSSYEVLRHSLATEQKRCESLNLDMVNQSEANDELVEALSTVKDANKRLLEQIRAQTSEISQLTQHRVGDEARMDQMSRRHEADRETVRQEAQKQVLAARGAGHDRHNQAYQQLSDKLRYVKTRGELMRQDTKKLQTDMQARRDDMAALVDFMQSQMLSAERDLASQCSVLPQLHERRQTATEDSIGDLELRLTAEREIRHTDGLTWSQKHGAVATNKEGTEAHMTRDVAQLSTHLQACERQAVAARNSWSEERAGLERQADDFPLQRAQRQATLEQLGRDTITLDSACSAAKSDSGGLEQIIIELRRQSRESDDALAAAVSGNEHLREQLDEQRSRFQDKNEADLADCRAGFEQKLTEMRLGAEADMVMVSKQVEAMEHDFQSQDEEVDRLTVHNETVRAECGNLDRDSTTWRSQYDSATTTRDVSEKKLQEEKQVFQHERLKLQAESELNSSQISAFEEEIRQTSASLQEFRRSASTRETEHTTRQAAAEGLLKVLQEMLNDCHLRVREVLGIQKRVVTDDLENRERCHEMQMLLERNVDNQNRLQEQESRRLTEVVTNERRSGDQMRNDFERERDSGGETLRRMHDESRSKVAGAERERLRLEEICRSDIGQAGQAYAQWHRKQEVLERDLTRVHALFAESESNLTWVLQERDHEDRETGLSARLIEDEVRTLTAALELAQRDEKTLTQQIDAQRQRNEEERRQMQRNLETSGVKVSSPSRRNPPLTAR